MLPRRRNDNAYFLSKRNLPSIKLRHHVFTRIYPLRLAELLPPLRTLRRKLPLIRSASGIIRRERFLRERPRHRVPRVDLGVTCF